MPAKFGWGGGLTSRDRKLHGVDAVITKLNRQIGMMENASIMGLYEAVEFIHAETERTPPLTPVDTGNLRSSWRTVLFRSKARKRSYIVFGYSANYALYVHEMLGMIKWTRPNSGNKWFEIAIKRNLTRIQAIITNNVKRRKL